MPTSFPDHIQYDFDWIADDFRRSLPPLRGGPLGGILYREYTFWSGHPKSPQPVLGQSDEIWGARGPHFRPNFGGSRGPGRPK